MLSAKTGRTQGDLDKAVTPLCLTSLWGEDGSLGHNSGCRGWGRGACEPRDSAPSPGGGMLPQAWLLLRGGRPPLP